MNRRLLNRLTALSLLLLCFISLNRLLRQKVGHAPSADATNVANAAEAVFSAMEERRVVGAELFTPSSIEMSCDWSRRLAIAKCDATWDPLLRIAALQAHLIHVQDLRSSLDHMLDATFSSILLGKLDYYVADAKHLLSQQQPHRLASPLALTL